MSDGSDVDMPDVEGGSQMSNTPPNAKKGKISAASRRTSSGKGGVNDPLGTLENEVAKASASEKYSKVSLFLLENELQP